MSQQFKVYKLGRRSNPENPSPAQVHDGLVFDCPMTPKIRHRGMGGYEWVKQSDFQPILGEPILFQGPYMGQHLVTSMIRSYYKECDKGEHPDKLVLPQGFPIEENIQIPAMKEGDYLLATMNSIYYLEAYNELR